MVRMKKAYPVYDQEYHDTVQVLQGYLKGFRNLQSVGRNGLHRYNNQDHSMMTGVLAARNIIDGSRRDVWSVNTEKSYHEEASESERAAGDRLIPTLVQPEPVRLPAIAKEVVATLYSRLEPLALGVAMGAVAGTLVFLMTVILLIRGGELVGPNLSLLGQYLWGYSVTWPGAFAGLLEGSIAGFLGGYAIATLRNAVLHAYLVSVRKTIELAENRDLLDRI